MKCVYLMNGTAIELREDTSALRDWFAGQVISSLSNKEYDLDYLAKRAYQIADALLRARDAGE